MTRDSITYTPNPIPPQPQPHHPPILTHRVINPVHLKPTFRQQALPRGDGEEAGRVVVHLDPQVGASLDEEHVCRFDGRVFGVEVCGVLDVGEFSFAVAIGLVLDAGRLERVGLVVGRGD